jgi:hypothetical protein
MTGFMPKRDPLRRLFMPAAGAEQSNTNSLHRRVTEDAEVRRGITELFFLRENSAGSAYSAVNEFGCS